MKTWVKVLIGVGALVILFFMFFSYANGVYSKAVDKQETVNAAFADVQSSYQRRADLIPSLMETVKGAAANEQTILTKVTEARARITTAQDEIKNAKTPAQLDAAGQKINTAFQLTVEAYPQIRSTENFLAFQAQLEGTENRINFSRDKYNQAIKEYNTLIRGFVKRMALGWLGEDGEFTKKEGFKAVEGSENAPKVKF